MARNTGGITLACRPTVECIREVVCSLRGCRGARAGLRRGEDRVHNWTVKIPRRVSAVALLPGDVSLALAWHGYPAIKWREMTEMDSRRNAIYDLRKCAVNASRVPPPPPPRMNEWIGLGLVLCSIVRKKREKKNIYIYIYIYIYRFLELNEMEFAAITIDNDLRYRIEIPRESQFGQKFLPRLMRDSFSKVSTISNT